MSITDGNCGMSAADFAAILGNRGGNGFGGFSGDGAWWLIVLFLFALSGNGWGNFGGNGGGNFAVPYMFNNANNDVQRGFDQQAVMGSLNGLTAAVSNGFANAEVSRCNAQTNTLQVLNGISMALQNCCCENRAATADLKYTVATEACADRAAVTAALNDLKTFTSGGFQAINDKLCQLELDGVKQRNADLLSENNALKFGISQTQQTADLVQRLNPTPVPAYMVQNPGCCNQNFNNCGCGN